MTKKWKFMISCLLLSMAVFTGCSDDDKTGDSGNGEPLSSEQSKEKLSEIGQELINLVNAKDQEKLVKLGNYFSEIVETLDFDDDEEVDGPIDEMQPAPIVRSLIAASQGNMSDIYALADVENDIYDVTEVYGIYTYNETTREWDKEESDSKLLFTFKYEGETAEITVAATGNVKEITFDDVTVKVPAKVAASIKLGSATLTSVELTTANVSDSPRKADITVNIDANGYKVSTSVSATPQKVTANYSITINGKEAIKGEAYLNGTNMTNDEDNNENIDDRFKDAQAKVDILGEAFVTLNCSSYKDLAKKIDEIEDQYDNPAGNWGFSHEAAQATSEAYKQYISGGLTFKGSDVQSASLAFQPYRSYFYAGSDGTTYEDWEVEPLLQFEDESLISFEDYFDAASGPFKTVADSFEALLDSFDRFIE